MGHSHRKHRMKRITDAFLHEGRIRAPSAGKTAAEGEFLLRLFLFAFLSPNVIGSLNTARDVFSLKMRVDDARENLESPGAQQARKSSRGEQGEALFSQLKSLQLFNDRERSRHLYGGNAVLV